jgi:16S rRNA (guanine527-N7)-methyltransferase
MPAADPSEGHAAGRELTNGALLFGIHLTPNQLTTFESYISTLLFWRTRLSLTGAATDLSIVRDHILDSLAVVQLVASASSAADLGSGAGFPGVPLAIVCPGTRIALIESRRKRANFLREVVRRCELANAEVIEGRAEHLTSHVTRLFDVVVSRALWAVQDLLRIGANLVRQGGLVVAMKGPKGASEIAFAPGFGGLETVTYKLQGGIERILLVYRKL